MITALAVWFATRVVLYFTATKHLFGHYGSDSVGDVAIYAKWAEQSLYYGHIPNTTEWQYPPLLAPILVLPEWLSRTFGTHYLTTFTALTFLADAVITALLLWAASHRKSWSGPWYWILGVPLLGPIVYGRYDVFPALCVVFALVLLGRGVPLTLADGRAGRALNNRRWAAGVMVGLGAAIKIWPGLTVFGLPRSRKGWQMIVTAVLSSVVSIAAMSLFFSGTGSWIKNQGGRGIEIESVWGIPWVIGKALHLDSVGTSKVVYGSYQVVPHGGTSSALISVSGYAALVAQVLGFGVMAYWWWRKNWRPAVTADATFVATLIMIVTSRVISPQYLIWLLAVAGFCLLFKDTTQRRSAVLVLICLPLTQYEFPFDFRGLIHAQLLPALVVALRNLLLMAATYYGFRDLWVSSVDGEFLPKRLRALVSRGGPSTDAAVVAQAASRRSGSGQAADAEAGAQDGAAAAVGAEEQVEVEVEAAK